MTSGGGDDGSEITATSPAGSAARASVTAKSAVGAGAVRRGAIPGVTGGRGPISKLICLGCRPVPARLEAPGRLSDGGEQQRVLGQLLLERALELRVDLADAALGHAEDVADLAQREVLDVEEDGDLALALRELLERGA